jgi:hypothetical protein
LETLKKEVELGKSPLAFVKRLELLKHEVGSGEMFNDVYVGWGNSLLDEAAENAIVTLPDKNSFWSSRRVRTRKRTVKPDV